MYIVCALTMFDLYCNQSYNKTHSLLQVYYFTEMIKWIKQIYKHAIFIIINGSIISSMLSLSMNNSLTRL